MLHAFYFLLWRGRGRWFIQWLSVDNRFGRMVFGLSRVAFTMPVVGRITYQAYATECKVRDEGSRPLSAVLWKIASGTADYREVLREMCGYGVLRSILVGAAVTLRNVAFESLFGLKCGEYGRYSSPRKPRRGKFHYRWQSAPSSDPQIRILGYTRHSECEPTEGVWAPGR